MKSLVLACLSTACATGALAASSEVPYQPELRGQTVQCSAFRHDADGGWTALESIPVQRQNEYTTISAGTPFHVGDPRTVGIDVAAALDAACPR